MLSKTVMASIHTSKKTGCVLVSGVLLYLQSSFAFPEELSADFLQWMATYTTEEGDFFDPLALFELTQLAQNMQDTTDIKNPDSKNSDVNSDDTQTQTMNSDTNNSQDNPSTTTGETSQ